MIHISKKRDSWITVICTIELTNNRKCIYFYPYQLITFFWSMYVLSFNGTGRFRWACYPRLLVFSLPYIMKMTISIHHVCMDHTGIYDIRWRFIILELTYVTNSRSTHCRHSVSSLYNNHCIFLLGTSVIFIRSKKKVTYLYKLHSLKRYKRKFIPKEYRVSWLIGDENVTYLVILLH